MVRTARLLVIAALVAGCDPPVPRQSSDPAPPAEPLTGIVAAHNAVRRAAQPAPEPPLAPLTESAELADAARVWAAGCAFRHSETGSGENLYASTDPPTARAVVESWAAEAAGYDYASQRCAGRCGHYTQVVWRDTAQVGCATQLCTTGSPFGGLGWWLVVCRYEPAGNYQGERPY